jgi:hypothetical protein
MKLITIRNACHFQSILHYQIEEHEKNYVWWWFFLNNKNILKVKEYEKNNKKNLDIEFLQIKIQIYQKEKQETIFEIDKIAFGLGRLFLKTNIYIPRHTTRNKCLKLDFFLFKFLDLNLVECSLRHDHHMKYHVTKYIYIFNMKFEKKCKCTWNNISKAKANWMKLCMNSSLDFNKKKFKCLINFISDYHKKILMSFSYKLAYSIKKN